MKGVSGEDGYVRRILAFSSISVGNIRIRPRQISGEIRVTMRDGREDSFNLIFSYSGDVEVDRNTAGLILTMPVINFTYFSENLTLDFPVSDNDRELIGKFLRINAREIFVNKICRRRYEFFRSEFLPSEFDIIPKNADGITELTAPLGLEDTEVSGNYENSAMVLSSGGKESLLTYGLLNEIGARVYPYFFNESGGHWKTAKTSYDFFSENYDGVSKVWSNVDRFYRYMIEQMDILDPAVLKKRADTYPIQLFIFPVYVFAALPIIRKFGIGNILMGNELDDPRDMPTYHGLEHYYGVFDQSNDFAEMLSGYLGRKGISSRLWSAVYPISGIKVEEILVRRYPELFRLQRSCHSCRHENGELKPCGKCTKCLGVMMFVEAAGGDPGKILYDQKDIEALRRNVIESRMRIDTDELSYLGRKLWNIGPGSIDSHVTGIHTLPWDAFEMEKIPEYFRGRISDIYSSYCSGSYTLENGEWNRIDVRSRNPEHQSHFPG